MRSTSVSSPFASSSPGTMSATAGTASHSSRRQSTSCQTLGRMTTHASAP